MRKTALLHNHSRCFYMMVAVDQLISSQHLSLSFTIINCLVECPVLPTLTVMYTLIAIICYLNSLHFVCYCMSVILYRQLHHDGLIYALQIAFLKQFHDSVSKSDYEALRSAFVLVRYVVHFNPCILFPYIYLFCHRS